MPRSPGQQCCRPEPCPWIRRVGRAADHLAGPFQVQSIEFTQIEMKVMEGLQVGNECLNKMHQVGPHWAGCGGGVQQSQQAFLPSTWARPGAPPVAGTGTQCQKDLGRCCMVPCGLGLWVLVTRRSGWGREQCDCDLQGFLGAAASLFASGSPARGSSLPGAWASGGLWES